MINVIVMGASGKMGGRIISLIQDPSSGVRLSRSWSATDAGR